MLLAQLERQTHLDFRLNIWNNSGKPLPISHSNAIKLQIIDSDHNCGSSARFKIILQTEGNPILFIDDDMIVHKDFMAYYHEQFIKYGSNCILGWHTRIFQEEHYWKATLHSPYGSEVDYIGTGGMILDRKIFDNESILQNLPAEYEKVEDLFLCYLARQKYNMKLIAIHKKCAIVADGKDQYRRLYQYKQNAFQSLRKMGWRLLNDDSL
jgi:hypothetical protein